MSREQLYICHCRERSDGWLIDLSVLIENLPTQMEEVAGIAIFTIAERGQGNG